MSNFELVTKYQKQHNKNLFELALEMGISEYSLYCFKHNYAKMSFERQKFIKDWLLKN